MHTEPFRCVRALRPPAAYIGGKRRLAPRLVQIIHSVSHVVYAEPFVGLGGIFLRRERVPKCEVINDLSGDVVCLFRVLQRHYAAFLDFLRFQHTSRREFYRLLAMPADTLTDIERAARFLYLQRLAFGGKVAGRNFGVSVGEPAAFNVSELPEFFEAISRRLAGVIIENLPAIDFVGRYDHPRTLFFLDPPYWGSEHYYGASLFVAHDLVRLADRLKALAGSFLLTINDVPETRELFAGFRLEEVELLYSVSDGKPTLNREIIVSNFEPGSAADLFCS